MQAELLEISLSTDLKEYCRRGYSVQQGTEGEEVSVGVLRWGVA